MMMVTPNTSSAGILLMSGPGVCRVLRKQTTRHVRTTNLQYKAVVAGADRCHHYRLQNLIVLVRVRRPHIRKAPLQVCTTVRQ